MKKIINFIAIAIFAITSCNSQVEEKTSTIDNQSLLWEISGNGLENSSYLFGTMHLVPKEDFFLPTGTIEAFESSNTLVMEIDIDIPLKEQISMVQRSMLPNNTTLADYMTEEDYLNTYSFLADSIGIGEKKLEKYIRFKPFMLAGILLTEAIGKVETYEKYFADAAKKQKIEFIALESVDFQLSIFDSIPVEDQIEGSFHSGMLNEYYEMLTCYTNQDLSCLHQMIQEQEDEDFEEILLKQRNYNWIEKLETEILPTGTTFIAVGAGHLPGSEGLIELLRAKGYELTPIIK